jgi:hypothetical protein
MCCVWILEQKAIISLYNMNRLPSVSDTACVYCAVQTEPLNKNRLHFAITLHHYSFTSFQNDCNVSRETVDLPQMLHHYVHHKHITNTSIIYSVLYFQVLQSYNGLKLRNFDTCARQPHRCYDFEFFELVHSTIQAIRMFSRLGE